MDSRKPRADHPVNRKWMDELERIELPIDDRDEGDADHPVNRKWMDELQRIVGAAMPARLLEGVHGEANFCLTIRDGLIQSVQEQHTTAHRQTAAADAR